MLPLATLFYAPLAGTGEGVLVGKYCVNVARFGTINNMEMSPQMPNCSFFDVNFC